MVSTIIHAGFHKTGTTTLQDFLMANRKWMASQGAFYPTDILGLGGHHGLACWLSSPWRSAGPNDLFVPEREEFAHIHLVRSMPASTFDNVRSSNEPLRILSSEIFSTFNLYELANLESFLGPIDRIILYFRNGIRYLYSCWASKVRWGFPGPFDIFLRRTLALHPATPISGQLFFAKNLAHQFGQERLSFRNFSTAVLHPRGLVGDFVEKELGLTLNPQLSTDRISNTTPSPVIVEALRALNILALGSDLLGFRSLHARFYQAMSHLEGALADELAHLLSPEMEVIKIRDVDSRSLEEDGSVRGFSSQPLGFFQGWSFPLDEEIPLMNSKRLLSVLGNFAPFNRIVTGT